MRKTINTIDKDTRTWVEINLKAVLHNFRIAQECSKKVICVLKADAYGHGAVQIANFLQNYGAYAFAVATLDEAIELRTNGIKLPILILGYTNPQYADYIHKYDIIQTVCSLEEAYKLNREAETLCVCIKAHIKVDTGMGRLGLSSWNEHQIKRAATDIKSISECKHLNITGLYSHLAAAGSKIQRTFTRKQFERFERIKRYLKDCTVSIEHFHIANSAAIMSCKEESWDIVRAGIMLYGLYPDGTQAQSPVLKPAMTLKTRVIQIKDVCAGASIGYNRTFKAKHNMKIAVISAGYADGYPRRLSGKGYVWIAGAKRRQIGTICMDMCMIDITGDDKVNVGDEVMLFGEGASSIEEVSRVIGTNNYEIICLITKRVKRIYIV